MGAEVWEGGGAEGVGRPPWPQGSMEDQWPAAGDRCPPVGLLSEWCWRPPPQTQG